MRTDTVDAHEIDSRKRCARSAHHLETTSAQISADSGGSSTERVIRQVREGSIEFPKLSST